MKKLKDTQPNGSEIILKQNDKMIKKIMSIKDNRHVKEPTEPIFKEIADEFSFNYGKLVVARTATEILKLVKNEF
jgi:hypothetical protein